MTEMHPNPTGLPRAPAPPCLAGSATHPCLFSPEISLDVDADRDGVVEKNNPKKVPSYQGRHHPEPGASEGTAPDRAGSHGSPTKQAIPISQLRRPRPKTGSQTHSIPMMEPTDELRHLIETATEQALES